MSRSSHQKLPEQQGKRSLQTWQRRCQLQVPSDQMQQRMQQQSPALSLRYGSAPGRLQDLPVCPQSMACTYAIKT